MSEAGRGERLPAGTLLGLDFGEKRIGVAVGESATGLAHALATVSAEANEARLAALSRIVDEWRPVGIVMGLPRHADGSPHEVARLAARFARRLEARFRLPIAFVDETLSSHEAGARLREAGRRASRPGGELDAEAAAVILQSYLEAGPA